MSGGLLAVSDLTIDYRTAGGAVRAVDAVSFGIAPGDVFGLVGESGSGKSTVGAAVLGAVAPNAVRAAGRVDFEGDDVLSLPGPALQRLRGGRIGFVPQNPTTSLNPSMRVGAQLSETLRAHTALDAATIRGRCHDLLREVGLDDADAIMRRFPHQLSGGQQQRVAIAMALSCEPSLIVLDEPTTGLDVTVQRQIVALLRRLQGSHGLAMLYITHDLPLLSSIATRIGVMREGLLVEQGEAAELFRRPRDAYTRALLAAIPSAVDAPARPCRGRALAQGPILTARRLSIGFRGAGPAGWLRRRAVVEDVDLDLAPDRTLALIGESGSGKSTTARALCGLVAPMSGEVLYQGAALAPSYQRRGPSQLREIQYVFQNPDASLNPQRTVAEVLARPLRFFPDVAGTDVGPTLRAAIERVRLEPALLDRYPGQLSGGQRQRVAIARALVPRPKVLLCDEVLSALDVSVQAQILELLAELRRETGVAMLFISHDLGVVRQIADEVAVMEGGRIVETGPTERVFTAPEHPYTQRLLAAIQRLPGKAA